MTFLNDHKYSRNSGIGPPGLRSRNTFKHHGSLDVQNISFQPQFHFNFLASDWGQNWELSVGAFDKRLSLLCGLNTKAKQFGGSNTVT